MAKCDLFGHRGSPTYMLKFNIFLIAHTIIAILKPNNRLFSIIPHFAILNRRITCEMKTKTPQEKQHYNYVTVLYIRNKRFLCIPFDFPRCVYENTL